MMKNRGLIVFLIIILSLFAITLLAGMFFVLFGDGNFNFYNLRSSSVSDKLIYDKVYNFSVEDYENEAYQKFFDINRKYDYIIFADLIEHLQNPEEIIISLSKKLKDKKIPKGKRKNFIKEIFCVNNKFDFIALLRNILIPVIVLYESLVSSILIPSPTVMLPFLK